jgi:glycosyltransferase involved in cell wall biosynthesis
MLQNARALLAPYWKFEPFGLTVLEAIACGTPVIALPFGSSIDIVRNGINGFVCADASEMVRRLRRIEDIAPSSCRQSIAFTHDSLQMARQYLRLFDEVMCANRIAEAASGSA